MACVSLVLSLSEEHIATEVAFGQFFESCFSPGFSFPFGRATVLNPVRNCFGQVAEKKGNHPSGMFAMSFQVYGMSSSPRPCLDP